MIDVKEEGGGGGRRYGDGVARPCRDQGRGAESAGADANKGATCAAQRAKGYELARISGRGVTAKTRNKRDHCQFKSVPCSRSSSW